MDNLWIWLVVGPTPLKNMSSSNGMMTFPTEWKKKSSKAPTSKPPQFFLSGLAISKHIKTRCSNAKHNQTHRTRVVNLPWPTLQENSLQVPLLKKKPGLHSAHSCGSPDGRLFSWTWGNSLCLGWFAFPDVVQVLLHHLAPYSSNQTGFQPTP